MTKSGINAAGNKITNVAAGTDDTDAVNYSQLKQQSAAARTEVAAGTNIKDVVKTTGANGQDVYTVNAKGTTASAGSNKVTVTAAAADANNVTDYSIDLAQDTKDDIQKGVDAKTTVDSKGLTFNGDSGSTNIEKLGSTVTVAGDDNITTEAQDDKVTVKLNKDLVVDSVKAGDTTVNNDGVKVGDDVALTQDGVKAGDVKLTKDGLNNGGNKVTDVAKGTADTDAVNVSQLNPIAKALNTNIDPTTGEVAAPSFTVTKADGTKHPAVGTVQDALDKVGEEVTKGLNIVADNGSSEKVNLGDTVKYTSKDKNIVTTSGTGKEIDFSLAEKVTIGKDAANGGKPVVIDGKEGIVSGLTNTTLGAAPLAGSNKAATEAQLDATQVNLANVLGGNAANNNGNVTTSDIGGTGENTIHDAIKSVKATADKGWKLKANDEADSDSEKSQLATP